MFTDQQGFMNHALLREDADWQR